MRPSGLRCHACASLDKKCEDMTPQESACASHKNTLAVPGGMLSSRNVGSWIFCHLISPPHGQLKHFSCDARLEFNSMPAAR